jgi:hypothetical protein
MGAEPQKLGILDQPLTLVTQVVSDHAGHLIEQELTGHAAEEGKRLLEAAHEHTHVFPGKNLTHRRRE